MNELDELQELISRRATIAGTDPILEGHIKALADKLNVDICTGCGEILPINEFSNTYFDEDNNPYCEDCFLEK